MDSMASMMPKESTNVNDCRNSSAQRVHDNGLTLVACTKKTYSSKCGRITDFLSFPTCARRRTSKVKSCVRFNSSVDNKYSLTSSSSTGATSLPAEDRATKGIRKSYLNATDYCICDSSLMLRLLLRLDGPHPRPAE